MTAVPDIMLNNGATIPQFGFGVFQIDPKDTFEAVATALQAGYRHVDTAEMYGNEREVGQAIAKSGLGRRDVQTGACSSSSTRSLKCVPLALSSLSWVVR